MGCFVDVEIVRECMMFTAVRFRYLKLTCKRSSVLRVFNVVENSVGVVACLGGLGVEGQRTKTVSKGDSFYTYFISGLDM